MCVLIREINIETVVQGTFGELPRKLARANRTLMTIGADNAVIVRAKSETDLLTGMCKVLVDVERYLLA
jgi:hypothetical protein